MKNINWTKYKFHPSGLKPIMTLPRMKDAELSATAKSALKDIWLAEVLDYKEDFTTEAMAKGIEMESDSLTELEQFGIKRIKNNITLENEWLIGTPDIWIKETEVGDVKTSWNIGSFAKIDEKEAMDRYEWQLQGYMYLTDLAQADLYFVLIDTPEHIINKQIESLEWKFRGDESESAVERFNIAMKRIQLNHLVSQKRNEIESDSEIPIEMRIKKYTIKRDNEKIDQLENKLQIARHYLATINL